MNERSSGACQQFVPTELDLHTLEALAQSDPQAFEAERQRLIDHCIDSAPEEDRAMLRRLQFRADGTRRRARTPLQSSLHMADLMWSAFYQLNARLNASASATLPAEPNDAQRSASVIPLHARHH